MAKRSQGLKAKVAELLAKSDTDMTAGDIARALDLTKIDHPDVASVLVKLRCTGRVKSSLGAASSSRGKRYVKRYKWVPEVAPQIIVVQEMDVRRQLAFSR